MTSNVIAKMQKKKRCTNYFTNGGSTAVKKVHIAHTMIVVVVSRALFVEVKASFPFSSHLLQRCAIWC